MPLTLARPLTPVDIQNICAELHCKAVRQDATDTLQLTYDCQCCGVDFESDMPEDYPLCETCFEDAGQINEHSDKHYEPTTGCRYCNGSTECACLDN